MVMAVCIVLTIFATFFQSEDIVFFYDKLLITDESIQVITEINLYLSDCANLIRTIKFNAPLSIVLVF